MLALARHTVLQKLSLSAAPAGSIAVRSITARVPTHEDDTHDDFKPKFNTDAEPRSAPSVAEQIQNDVQQHPVFLYMKGVPEAPQCGFSNMACRILDAYGASYGTRNVLADVDIREGIKEFTKWPTIPQIFINGEFVGGSDILMGMHQSGELQPLLDEAVTTKSAQ
ncbi:hypothetical protein CVIRNUC_009574 [Coccomyxa viridis]|uniref:Glutaredoxin domain-containing protein n=1 Tax=Coccomyxa viridis TaxID=1274662 RepID=A0AAV1IGC4_9CHLO|nr:hypothetical protein CVIRNUC_009574 [Coccomyxa viridis]